MFNKHGFSRTSLDDVAAELGVTKPVVYNYLGNKDRVLLECLRIGLEQLVAAAEDVLSIRGTGADRLRSYLLRYAEITMSEFGRCVIRTGDDLLSPASRVEFRRMKRLVDNKLRELISAAAADESLRVCNIRTTSFAIAGALNWPAQWYRETGPETKRQIAEQIVDLLFSGLERSSTEKSG